MVDPGQEICGAEAGEGEEQVSEVAFGIDADGGNAIDGGFFEECDSESGFSAAGHTGDNGVCGEVSRVIQEWFVRVCGWFGGVLEFVSKKEGSEFFVIVHGEI